MSAKKLTQEDLDRVAGLPSREAAEILGVGKTTVNYWRERARLDGGTLNSEQGETRIEATGEAVPTTAEEVTEFLAKRGISNLTHRINYSFGGWDSGEAVSHSFKANATPLAPAVPPVDWSEATERIRTFDFVPSAQEFLTETAVIQPTDYQIGKTDVGGGTLQSTERALQSIANFAEIVRDRRPANILIANTGDIIENFCNTSSQLSTNDLDLPSQVGHAFALELEIVKQLAPLAGNVLYATVPSNHGQWRSGPKQNLGDSHADWGIVIARQLGAAIDLSPIDNVQVHIPVQHMESMTVGLGTSKIGLVHGHQKAKPESLGDWWAGQDHGRMPTWDADILLAGHFHSMRIYQSGDGRWVFVGPSSDPGSSWYSNLTGQQSVAGMLTFFTEKGAWSDLKIV
jgi:transposase